MGYKIQQYRKSDQFLFFQVFEEAFHHSIIMRVSFVRKGLNHVEQVNFFAEIGRSELGTSIRVEHNSF